MGLIYEKLRVIGLKGERTVSALMDTGSSHSLLREDIARAIGKPEELPEPKQYELAVGTFVARLGLFADVVVEGHRLTCGFKIVAGLSEEMILGVDFFQLWGVRLDPKNHLMIVDPRSLRLKAVGMRVPRSRRRH